MPADILASFTTQLSKTDSGVNPDFSISRKLFSELWKKKQLSWIGLEYFIKVNKTLPCQQRFFS